MPASTPTPTPPEADAGDAIACARCGRKKREHLTSSDPGLRGWLFCDHNRIDTFATPQPEGARDG